MNRTIPNTPQQTISTFDLIETFHIESQSLHHQIKTISQTINTLIQITETVFFPHFIFLITQAKQ